MLRSNVTDGTPTAHSNMETSLHHTGQGKRAKAHPLHNSICAKFKTGTTHPSSDKGEVTITWPRTGLLGRWKRVVTWVGSFYDTSWTYMLMICVYFCTYSIPQKLRNEQRTHQGIPSQVTEGNGHFLRVYDYFW